MTRNEQTVIVPLSALPAMFRLNPKPRFQVIPSLAALVVFTIACAAGNWQAGRAGEKDVIETRHAALLDAPAVALPRSVARAELDALDGRRMVAQGEFLNDKTVFLDNQVLNRIAGYHVLTPLRAVNGAVVLVNRGWVRGGADRAQLPPVAPITGRVSIEGRAALPPGRIYEIKPDDHPGRLWQNLVLPAMSNQAGVDLLPFVLRLSSDVGDGLVRIADAGHLKQDIGGGMTAAKHRGYAFQWYSLAALTFTLFVFFTFVERSGPNGKSSGNA